MEISEEQIRTLEEAKKGIEQLNEISRVCLLYNQGANAEACMDSVKRIILDE